MYVHPPTNPGALFQAGQLKHAHFLKIREIAVVPFPAAILMWVLVIGQN